MADILATKLHIPQLRTTLVDRHRLTSKLKTGLERKLSVVAAPAGFGKTTLLSAWKAAFDIRVAWLSLDSGDNDPTRFMHHFIAALGRINAELSSTAHGMLQTPDPPSLESVLTVLINGLNDEATAFSLVLDDYHVIKTATIHEAITFLVDHLPPAMRVIIASRTDPPLPLARLRAQGELLEVRAADLRFTSDEATAFLNKGMNLRLSREEIEALGARTEGWNAGLQLVGLALQGSSDVAGFIETFTGSHRYIADYLVEDVLQKQSEVVQLFLRQTSILERLTGPLCNAVTLGKDSGSILKMLENANLFLVPLDEKQQWYRYHQLFAEVLQNRQRQVQPDKIPELHRRAAQWLEREGLVTEAAEHALSAGEVEWAARLVEMLTETLWPRGELMSVFRWLERLPQEVVRHRPQLLLASAWSHFLHRSYGPEEIEDLLTEAETLLDDLQEQECAVQGATGSGRVTELRGILAAIRTAVASSWEDGPQALAYAREALDHLPHNKMNWRTVVALSAGLAYDALGDASAADGSLAEAITLGQAVGNTYLAHVATINLARMRVVQGKLHSAAELSEQALELAGGQGGGRSPNVGYPHVVLGKLRYEWNDLEGAARHLNAAIERAQVDEHRYRPDRVLLDGYLALARTMLVQGNLNSVRNAVHRAEQVAQAASLPWVSSLVAAHRACIALRQGRLEEATRWADETGLRADDEPGYPSEFAHTTLARVLIAQGQLDDALFLLERLLQAAETGGRSLSALELLVLRALALQKRGNSKEALIIIERALTVAEPEGYVRLFIDEVEPMATLLQHALAEGITPEYTAKLLASFPLEKGPVRKSTPAPHPSVGLLNAREMAVLRLMSGRLSDKEIAKALSLSVSTVKWYSNRIYEKLGAHRRGEAVTRAKKLGIL